MNLEIEYKNEIGKDAYDTRLGVYTLGYVDWLEEKLVNKTNDIHDATNCYILTEEQKKMMDTHKANKVKFSHGSGIGVSVEIKTKKGKWKDITDYSRW